MSAPLHAGIHPQDQRQTLPPQEPEADTPLGPEADTPRQTPPGRHPPYRHTPQCMLGTHPTGMHLCLKFLPPAKEVAGSYNVFIRVFLSVSSQGTSHVTITHDALHLTIKETPPPTPVKGPGPLPVQGPLWPWLPKKVQTCPTWTSLHRDPSPPAMFKLVQLGPHCKGVEFLLREPPVLS